MKSRPMVVEILQIEDGVHGCNNTNRNENYYFLSSRGGGSFDEGNKSQLVRGTIFKLDTNERRWSL